MDNFTVLALVLVVLVAVVSYGFVFIRISPKSYESNWRELARRTSLEYSPAGASLSGKKTSPFISGTYRGYSVVIHRDLKVMWWTRDRNITAYTCIRVSVNNPAGGYLIIRNAAAANVQLMKLFGTKGFPTGDILFDNHIFVEKSQPKEFTQTVLGSDVLRYALQRAFKDTTRRHIELVSKQLRFQEVWDPSHMSKRNVEYLQRHLDVLIDLAEAIDKQRSG